MNMENNKNPVREAQTQMLWKFNERLATFPSKVGNRNPQLLGLVNFGLRAGLSDDQIEDAIIERSGKPPMTSTEIRHALDTAHNTTGCFKANASKPAHPPLGPGASTFVSKMIEVGADATIEKLSSLSPIPIPEAGTDQTKLFLSTIYGAAENLFIGGDKEAGAPGRNIRSVTDWSKQSASGPFLIVNPLTGKQGMTQTGNPSYRCGQCIASRKYALVEFDAMTLEKQACFWTGVIATVTLPLRSLVHSGGKSIHGIVEIAAKNLEDWSKELTKLMFTVANPAAECHCQADKACRNADRLTRLAGATRPESGAMQRLLWLSNKPLGI